jgi:hypothetical protein
MASAVLATSNRLLGQPDAPRPFDILLRRHNDPARREPSASRLLAPLAALATAEPLGGGLGYFNLSMAALPPPSLPQSATPTAAQHREPRVRLLDVAPYARAVARHDLAREAERARSYLLSTQGSASGSDTGAKRVRLTRASRSAVEGGRREETRVRRERWWGKDVNLTSLLLTGGASWGIAVDNGQRGIAEEDAMEI